MVILILNMNSHARDFRREELNGKVHLLAQYIHKHRIDIVALQKCSQTSGAAVWGREIPGRFHSCESGIAIKEDNAAGLLARLLAAAGKPYEWTWGSVKQVYGRYDEGLAIFSRHPIRETDFFTISRQDVYDNRKTRKALGASVRIQEGVYWFYNIHMDWCQEEEETFQEQIQRLQTHLFSGMNHSEKNAFPPGFCSCKIDYRISKEDDILPKKESVVILMGDFNSPVDIYGKGYFMLNWMAQDARIHSSHAIFNEETELKIFDPCGVVVHMEVLDR